MLKDYLNNEIYNLIIRNFNFNDINEIRMRINEKLIIVIKNKKYYLKDDNNNFIIINKFILDNFIKKISENSIYAFNDSIIQGYITLPKGIRIGLTGTVVTVDNKITTIKDFQSANIRIPHTIKNCCLPAFDFLFDGDVKNTLVVSSPGGGKTTFIRDFVCQLYANNISKNVLIADERNEICSSLNGEPCLKLGGFCDIYANCSKKFAFKNGIRSMNPDVIITDEIDLERDMEYLIEAINSGVNVVATIHAKDIEQLKQKKGFDEIICNKYFSRYVILNCTDGPGTIANIYDERLNCIYCKL